MALAYLSSSICFFITGHSSTGSRRAPRAPLTPASAASAEDLNLSSPRSRGSPAASRTSAGARRHRPPPARPAGRRAPSPRRRSPAPGAPVRPPLPVGRGCPTFGRIRTRARVKPRRPLQPRAEGLPRDPFVGLQIARPCPATTSSGIAGAGGSLSHPLPAAQSRTYCLSKLGWLPPGSYPSAGQ